MKLSLKTFILFSVFSGLTTLIFSLLVFFSQRSKLDQEYQAKYLSMTSTLASTFTELETVTDNIMLSALENIKFADKENGLMSIDDLIHFRDKLSVSDIFITNHLGQFLRMTNGPIPPNQPNLFSFCEDYKNLVTGSLDVAVTPIITALPDPTHIKPSYKFMMIPNHNKTRILEVGMKLDFIVRILKQSALAYPELLSLGLYAPSGDSLGEYKVTHFDKEVKTAFDSSLEEKVEILDDSIVVWKRVNAKVQNCCECRIKALTKDLNTDRYSYFLRAVISRKPLLSSVADLRNTVLLFCLGIVIFSLLVSRYLSGWLLSELQAFVMKIEDYLNGRLAATEVGLTSKDEVGFISRTLSVMLVQLEKVNADLIQSEKQRAQDEVFKEKAQLAAQVSHDIRSPLTALNMVLGTIDKMPEDKRLIVRSAIQRINDIANSLLQKGREASLRISNNTTSDTNKTSPDFANSVMLSALVDTLVSEKRIQFRDKIGVQIEVDLAQSFGLFVNISPSELSRVLSNLINNSVEAFPEDKGSVLIFIEEFNGFAKIQIKDNGKGIPADILKKLETESLSFGKESESAGFGLGLSYARKVITAAGGSIQILSQRQQGTEILILIPKAPAPSCFLKELNIPQGTTLVALDDDQSIHSVWKGRLQSIQGADSQIELLSFTSAEVFIKWHKSDSQNFENLIYLVDYELLGQTMTGLTVIEQLGIQKKSVLVTSRNEEKNILEGCQRLGIKMIPKAMAGLIPFKVTHIN